MPRDTLLIGSILLLLAFGVWQVVRPEGTSWGGEGDKPPEKIALIEMRNLEAAVDSYYAVHHKLPDRLAALTQTSDKSPHPFLDEVRLDPWGNPFEYRLEGKTFRIRSYGEDGRPDTDDDIVWPAPR